MGKKKEKKGQYIKIPKGAASIVVGFLNTEVMLLFNDKQRKNVAKQLGVCKDDHFLISKDRVGGMASVLYGSGAPFFTMFLPNEDVSIVVHECVHMAHMLMDEHAIPVSMENTETMAYLTGYLFDQVYMAKAQLAKGDADVCHTVEL